MTKAKGQIVLVVHNVRSANNVGSLLRTAEGLGVVKAYLTGYTPYPETAIDKRLPHERAQISRQIHKTALGAESLLDWEQHDQLAECLGSLRQRNYSIVALEQTPQAVGLNDFLAPPNLALVVGNEVKGLDWASLKLIKYHVKIPMSGQKESFNVAVAAGIALYTLSQKQN